jgi:uncharacterized protein YbaP (TraB family)
MMRAALRCFSLFALLLVAACGSAPSAIEQGGGPALWRVQKGDLDGWLFGTVHALPDGVAWQTPRIDAAIDKADRLVLEVGNLNDQVAVTTTFERLGRSPSLPPIAERIAPDERSALDQLTAKGTVQPERLRPYESWAAAMLLSANIQQTLNVSEANGVEPALTARFRAAGKTIEGLETVEAQFSAFDTLPEAAQRRMLGETIADADEMRPMFDGIVKAWMKGDIDAIARADSGRHKPDPVVEAAVLIARNKAWVKKIETMHGHPFIAVGTAHLAGTDNLIALLRAQGFTVTRLP